MSEEKQQDVRTLIFMSVSAQINASRYDSVENYHRDIDLAYSEAIKAYERNTK